jgi:putative transposase
LARKTYKFRLYPTGIQVEKLESWLTLSCELYNAGLQERRDAWKLNRVSISYAHQNKQLTEIKQIRTELNDINSHVLQDALQRLNKSFDGFFLRVKKGVKAGFPRFKSSKRYDSFSVPNSRYKIENGKFDLSRFGKIKIKQDCEIEGVMKTATVKRECGKWFVCIGVDFTPTPLPYSDRQVGIDVGIKHFAVLTVGAPVPNPRFAEKLQKKLRVAQRRVARRKKGSTRRRKAVAQLQKIHLKIRNSRTHFQHKLSYKIVRDFGFIAIEKLNIKGLAAGMLAKQVNDAAWRGFFEKLVYKAENAGRELIEVNPSGTSQTCLCGASVPKTLAQRRHKCESCGIECDRDWMSAQVILQRAVNQKNRSSANVNH